MHHFSRRIATTTPCVEADKIVTDVYSKPRSFWKSRVDAVLRRMKSKERKGQGSGWSLCSVHGTSVQGVEQFWAFGEGLAGLRVAEPIPIPLMLLGPLSLLLLDGGFEEMVRGLWGVRGELVGPALFGDEAEVIVDLAYYAGFFPGLALGSILGGCFVRLPAAFGEDPAVAFGRLDEQDVVLVGGEGDHAGD